MVAASPGKVDGEAAKEVEEGPGQDNNVVGVEEQEDHLGGIADACRGNRQTELGTTDFSYTTHPCLGEGLCSTVGVLNKKCWSLGACSVLYLPSRHSVLRAPTALPRSGGDLSPNLLWP